MPACAGWRAALAPCCSSNQSDPFPTTAMADWAAAIVLMLIVAEVLQLPLLYLSCSSSSTARYYDLLQWLCRQNGEGGLDRFLPGRASRAPGDSAVGTTAQAGHARRYFSRSDEKTAER